MAVELCELLAANAVERATPAIAAERSSWQQDRDRWLRAARAILETYEPDRVRAAIALLRRDWLLGSEIFTMPELARQIRKAVARAEIRDADGNEPESAGAPPWHEAWRSIERAIRRHGRGGKEAALRELRASSWVLAAFVEQVGWNELCLGSADRHGPGWRRAYLAITNNRLRNTA